MVENNFSYNIKNDDKSREGVMHKEDFFGYKHVEPTTFSNKLIELKDEILNDKELINYLEYDSGYVNSWYLRKKAIIWKELGINLNTIQYLNPDFNLGEDGFYGKSISDFYEGLLDDSPIKLPIMFIKDFNKTNFLADYLEFSKHNSIIFKCIYLPKVDRKICSAIYAHELTHIEQENAGGGINKITNSETLPIFIELLFAEKLGVDQTVLKHRLIYLAGTINKLLKEKNINFELRIKLETYLISIIQGISLFNKYNDGNEIIKCEIIDFVNKIFKGEEVVENMLDSFDSNYKDVELKIKTLKR